MKKAFPPLVFPNSKVLILGSMPGERSLALQQYYGHPGNQFWKLLFAVFAEPFSADYGKRVELLKTHRIALWDVLSHCEREGSSDAKIKNEIPNDFDRFYADNPQIRHVFFDSLTVKRFYKKYIGERHEVSYHSLPSPSGQYASMSFGDKLEQWQILRDFI